MPYRRKPRSQRKHSKPKFHAKRLRGYSPIRRSILKYGIVPLSVSHPSSFNKYSPISKLLASSSKHERDYAVAQVSKILSCSDPILSDIQLHQLWQSLFYCFWMSDQTLIQQELAQRLSSFIYQCYDQSLSLNFVRHFFLCMKREWIGIDFIRMDKFFSLVRHFLYQTLKYLIYGGNNHQTVDDVFLCQTFSNILRNDLNLLQSDNRGLCLHLCDIFVSELIRVLNNNRNVTVSNVRKVISFDALFHLLIPFLDIYLQSNIAQYQKIIIRKVFAPVLESMKVLNEEQRDWILKHPGIQDLQLYNDQKVRVRNRDRFHIRSTINFDSNRRRNDNRCEKNEKNEMNEFLEIKENKKQQIVDGNGPELSKKRWLEKKERKLGPEAKPCFDVRNFNVFMPLTVNTRKKNEKSVENDSISDSDIDCELNEFEITPLNDPLGMKDKLLQFKKVFLFLANTEQTPDKHRKKLIFLAKMFSDQNENAECLEKAVFLVDKQQMWKKGNRRNSALRKRQKHMRIKQHKKIVKLQKLGVRVKFETRQKKQKVTIANGKRGKNPIYKRLKKRFHFKSR